MTRCSLLLSLCVVALCYAAAHSLPASTSGATVSGSVSQQTSSIAQSLSCTPCTSCTTSQMAGVRNRIQQRSKCQGRFQ